MYHGVKKKIRSQPTSWNEKILIPFKFEAEILSYTTEIYHGVFRGISIDVYSY